MLSKKSEGGYALLTVLLMITIFMVFFLSFMGQAFSSVKQNQVVERSSQSVAVAEMGVSYYKVATQHIFETNRQTVVDRVNQILNPLPNEEIDQDEAREATVTATAEILKTELMKEQSQVNVDDRLDTIFSITNIDSSTNLDENTVNVHFSVLGTQDAKSTPLEANVAIDLSSIIIEQDSINFVLPAFDEVPKPQPGCTSFANGCSELLVDGSQPLPGKSNNNGGNNNGLSDAIVYSTGPLTINGNANNSYNLRIHAENDFTIEKNMNGATKLTLETKEDAIFNGHLKVEASRLIFGGDLINGKHLELDRGSFAFVGGNATMDKLDISSNSTMCVQGSLTVLNDQKNVDNTSKLIVKSVVGEDEFERQCGSPSSVNLSINWGQNIETKVDKVDYK